MKTFEPKNLAEVLNEGQLKVLEEMDLYPEDFTNCNPQLIHEFAIRTRDAYSNGNILLFVDCGDEERKKFLYYIGAENEAEMTVLYKDIAVYENIDESRLERFCKSAEEAQG